MTVSEELKQKAIKLDLCPEWTADWKQPDLGGLCDMFISGQDFCIKHDYPSTEYIKENFGKVAEDHGIFVDTEIDLTNPNTAILMGATKGNITLSGFVSRDIYVRHDSEVIVTIKDSAKAFIRVFNNARVTVDNQTNGKVFVYKYTDGFTGKIFTNENVMIREKSFKEL